MKTFKHENFLRTEKEPTIKEALDHNFVCGLWWGMIFEAVAIVIWDLILKTI